MKIIDKNGRLFGKISVIDVMVILVVAVMAVALYLKTNTMTHTSTVSSNQTITYQLYARGVAESVEDVLRLEDQVFDEDRGNSGCLGKIKNIEILPGTEMISFDDGTVGIVPSEGTVDILLTIEGEGLINGKNYSLNRVYDLGVNSARNFCTHYARFTATVYSIG